MSGGHRAEPKGCCAGTGQVSQGLQGTGLTHAAGAGRNADHWGGGVQALAVQQEAVVCMQLQVPAGCAHQDAAVLILQGTRLSLHV